MSKAMDEKIVKLTLQDADFKTRAKNAIASITNLKDSFSKVKNINLGQSVQALGSLKTTAVDTAKNGMGTISQSVNDLISKYPSLQTVATGALMRIGNIATDAGLKMAKALILDPPSMGFGEYEQKMKSTTTIMTNTGASIKEVNAILDDMNTYSDKTIYSFADMTAAMGAMGASGLKLQDSSDAIKGFFNAAAGVGVDSARATGLLNTALNQSISLGYLNYENWKQLSQAGFGQKFKNTLIDTANEMGKNVDKTGDFNTSLKDGWATTDVLVAALRKMSKDESLLSAAQQARTWSQAWDTAKESVVSGWAQSWEIIFGGYEEATKMWTAVQNAMSAVIGQMSAQRNTMLQWLKDLGVFSQLKTIIVNTFSIIGNVIKAIKAPFTEVFNMIKGDGKKATAAIAGLLTPLVNFTKKLKESKTFTDLLTGAVRLLLLPIRLLIRGVQGGIEAFKNMIAWFKKMIAEFMGTQLYALIKRVQLAIDSLKGSVKIVMDAFGYLFDKIGKGIMTKVQPAIDAFVDGFETFLRKFVPFGDVIADIIDKIQESFKKFLTGVGKGMDAITFTSFTNKVRQIAIEIASFIYSLNGDTFKNAFKGMASAMAPFAESVSNFLHLEKVAPVLNKFKKAAEEAIGVIFDYFGLGDVGEEIDKFKDNVVDMSKKVVSHLGDVKPAVSNFVKGLGPFLSSVGEFLHLKEAGDAIVEFAKGIGPFMSSVAEFLHLKEVGEAISEYVGTAIDALAVLADGMSVNFESIRKASRKFKDDIKPFLDAIAKFLHLKEAGEALKNFGADFKDFAGKLDFGSIKTIVGLFAKFMLSKFGAVGKILSLAIGDIQGFAKFYSKAAAGFSKGAWEGIVATFGAVKDAIGTAIDYAHPKLKVFVKYLKEEVFTTGNIGKGVAFGSLILGLSSVYKISKGIGKVTGAIGSVGGFLDKIGDSFKGFTKKLGKSMKASTILMYAVSIGILAFSMVQLAKVPVLDLVKAGTAMALAMTAITVSMKLFFKAMETSKISGKQSAGLALAIVGVGLAVIAIAKAAQMFGDIDGDKVAQSLGGIAVALVGIMGFAAVAGKFDFDPKGMMSLIGVALAVAAIALAAKLFGEMDLVQLVVGLAGAGVALLEIGAFTRIAKEVKLDPKTAISIGLLALAITALYIPVKLFGRMDWKVLALGLAAVGAGLFIFAEFSKTVDGNGLLKTAASLGLLAISITMLAVPIAVLGMMPVKTLEQGGMAVAAIAIGLAALGVALRLTGGGKGMIELGGALAIIAASMMLLVPVVILLGSQDLATLGKGLGAMAVGLLIIVGVGYLAEGAAIGLLVLSQALLGIGVGMGAVAIVLTLIGKLLEWLSTVGAKSVKKIVENLKTMLDEATSLIDPMATLFEQMILRWLQSIVTLAPAIGTTLLVLLQTALNVIVGAADEIAEAVLTLITNLLQSISDHIGKIVELGMQIVINLINGIAEKLPDLIDAAINLVITFIQGLADAISEHQEEFREAMWSLVQAVFDLVVGIFGDILSFLFGWVPEFIGSVGDWLGGVWDKITEIWGGLADFVGGLWNGAKDMVVSVGENIKGAAKDLAQGAKDKVGEIWDGLKGFAEGIWNKAKDGVDAAKKGIEGAAESAAKGAKKAFKTASDLYESGKNMIKGAIDGINDKANELWEATKSAAEGAWGWFKKTFDINSPSRKMKWAGHMIIDGAVLGINDRAGRLDKSMTNVAETSIKTFTGVAGAINDEMGKLVDVAPVITPKLNMAEIQNGQKLMQPNLTVTNEVLGNVAATSTNTLKVESTIDTAHLDEVFDKLSTIAERPIEVPVSVDGKVLTKVIANPMKKAIKELQNRDDILKYARIQ